MQNSNHSQLEIAVKNGLDKTQLPLFEDFLFHKIVQRIAVEKELKKLKPKLWAAFGIFTSSLALLALALNFSFQAFAQSQTLKYLSLIFTDFNTVWANWQDFSFSVLENLPVGAIAFVLASGLATLFILDFSFKQFNNFKKLKI